MKNRKRGGQREKLREKKIYIERERNNERERERETKRERGREK